MPGTDDDLAGGVFNVIAESNHELPTPVETQPTQTQTPEKTETNTPTPKEESTETNNESEEEDDDRDAQDFSRTPIEDREETEETETPTSTETTPEPSKTETTPEAEKPREKAEWEKSLPAQPPQFNLEPPKVDEQGVIVNMNAEQYQTYLIERAKYEWRVENYVNTVENKALDAAEEVLPQIKTSQAVRTLVENARTAGVINGKQIDSYQAALLVKEALGLGDEQLAKATQEAAAKATANVKASIKIQKNAALETQGTTKKKATPSREAQLQKRLRTGDENAMVELLDIWQKDGKV